MRGCGRGSRLLTGRSALCTAACRSPRAWRATSRCSLRVARVHALGRCPAPPHPQAAPARQPLLWGRTRRRQRLWGRTRRRQRRSPRRLRPLRYDSERPTTKGSYGSNASYEHEWRISTWAFNLPGTFPHGAFRQRYGTPFDEGLLALVRGAGLLRLLELVKRQFEHALLARGDAAAAAVGAATLSQLFLTVQPHKQRMNDELASYMQSHYDPAAARLGLTPSAKAPRRPRPRPDSSLEPLVPPEASAVAAQATVPRPGCAWVGGRRARWGGEVVDACSATARTRVPPGYSPPASCIPTHTPLHPPMHTACALQVLTINIHLSPLDYCGCLPSENGLVLHGLDLTRLSILWPHPPWLASPWPSLLRCCTASTAASSRR